MRLPACLTRVALAFALLVILVPAAASSEASPRALRVANAEPTLGTTPAARPRAASPRVLRVANAEPTLGTSPLDGSTSASMRVWELMHDGLWDRDASFQPVPWLAESWDTSPDSTMWTFRLRPGLTFSDGSPITSTDVQAS